MTQLIAEKYMTVKELINTLGVPKSTLHEVINRVLPGIKKPGKTTYLNEEQVSIISVELKKAHNTQSPGTRTVAITQRERQEVVARAWQYIQEDLQAAKEALESEKREKAALQIKLDESKQWYSIKRMEKLNPGYHFSWQILKRESERMGIEPRKVFDANYGEVNSYHISVWESLFFDTLNYEEAV